MKTRFKSSRANALVNDVLMQIAKTVDGNYQGANYFSLP